MGKRASLILLSVVLVACETASAAPTSARKACDVCDSDVDCARGLYCDHATWTCRSRKAPPVSCDSDCAVPSVGVAQGKTLSLCAAFGRCVAVKGSCVATTAAQCAASWACQTAGACTLSASTGVCVK